MKRELGSADRTRKARSSIFSRLIACLPLYCISMLLDLPSLCQRTYYVQALGQDAEHPKPGMIPWPLIAAATCFSKKFIPFDRKVCRSTLNEHCINIENKLKYLASRQNMPERRNLYGILHIVRSFTESGVKSHSDIPLHKRAAFTIITGEIRKCIARSVIKAQHAVRNDHMFLFRVCKWLLNDQCLAMVETDKDGGYAFIPSALLRKATYHVLIGGDYSFETMSKQSMFFAYTRLSKRWASYYGFPGLASLLCRSLRCSKATIHSILRLTCKTHKSPVSFRNLHCAPCWALGCLSRFVSNMLQEILNSHAHVLRDCKHFVGAVSGIMPKATHRFCKLDVQHFFMSGESFEIAQLISTLFDDPNLKSLVYDTVFFLLDSQFVYCKHNQQTYKVSKGSGMGLPHSGATSECALLSKEIPLMKLLHTYGIDYYGRFKNDISIIYNRTEGLNPFLGDLRQGHPFSIDVETISSTTVDFLEVRVSKCPYGYATMPVSKPSTLNCPWLSRHSCHPPHIHHSWPVARAMTRLGLCSSPQLKCCDLRNFIARAQTQNLSNRSINTLKNLLIEISNGISRPKHQKRESVQRNSDVVWLVLPYFQAMHVAGLSRDLHNLFKCNYI